MLPQGELYQGIATTLQRDPAHAACWRSGCRFPDEVAGTISLHALVLHELATRSGGMPVGNRGMVYSGFGDDAAFNAGVQRIDAVPAAQARARDAGADRRTAAPAGDPVQPQRPDHRAAHADGVSAVGRTRRCAASATVLPSVGEGHCGFSEAQVVDALKTVQR
jgi:hypothetical protein